MSFRSTIGTLAALMTEKTPKFQSPYPGLTPNPRSDCDSPRQPASLLADLDAGCDSPRPPTQISFVPLSPLLEARLIVDELPNTKIVEAHLFLGQVAAIPTGLRIETSQDELLTTEELIRQFPVLGPADVYGWIDMYRRCPELMIPSDYHVLVSAARISSRTLLLDHISSSDLPRALMLLRLLAKEACDVKLLIESRKLYNEKAHLLSSPLTNVVSS